MRVRVLQNTSIEEYEHEPNDLIEHRLTIGAEYEVLAIEADYLRLIDDGGEPALFPPSIFEIVDSSRPECWVSEFIDDDSEEYPAEYSHPPELDSKGSFGDFFDRDPDAVSEFWRFVNRHLRL